MRSANSRRRLAGRPPAPAATLVLLLACVVTACGTPDERTVAVAEIPRAPASLAEAPADVPFLTVGLLGVTRASEGAVDVRLSLTCAADAPAPVPIAELFASLPSDAGTVADVYAVDEQAGKKYFVVRDADGRPVGSRELDPLAPGASRELWTRLGVPFAVATVTIQVPHVQTFGGVRVADPRSAADVPTGGTPPRG